MTASWLGQMNWEVYVLETDFNQVLTEQGVWKSKLPNVHLAQTISAKDLNHFAKEDIAIWDVPPLQTISKAIYPVHNGY